VPARLTGLELRNHLIRPIRRTGLRTSIPPWPAVAPGGSSTPRSFLSIVMSRSCVRE